ncbi:hypothetical protein LTR53_004601 [Teratosphaeriaceae sp. CCFEE 6253]|nr:hypothetical protein LTR53_004601 [Teratosphaeriaceae sp. CCFEE 6253]
MTQLGSKKSRKGCDLCKRRRVKCSEGSPCANCARRGEACSLAAPSPSTTAVSFLDSFPDHVGRVHHRAEMYAERPQTSHESNDSLPTTTEDWLQDMQLMHHYTVVVCHENLLVRHGITAIWSEYVPKQALKHSFLLHGLLALSALNLANRTPDADDIMKYLNLCDKHQAVAVAALRDALNGNITAENGGALFALAATTSISSMARSCIVANAQPAPRAFSVDEIAEVIVLTKGMREVVAATQEHVLRTPLASMLVSHSLGDDEKATLRLPEPVHVQFALLREMLQNHCADDPLTRRNCGEALDVLQDIYLNLVHFKRLDQVESGHIWRWPAAVPLEFVRLITARHPPTLVIVAYFAAATSCLGRGWYVRDWGTYTIEGITRALEGDVQHWLEWPRAHMKDELAILLT